MTSATLSKSGDLEDAMERLKLMEVNNNNIERNTNFIS